MKPEIRNMLLLNVWTELTSLAYGWIREQLGICCPDCDSFFGSIDPGRLSSRDNTDCAIDK